MIKDNAKLIGDKLLQHAEKSENFTQVVEFLAGYESMSFNPSELGMSMYSHQLTWQSCPSYVLGAVLAIGNFMTISEDALLSDELLPAIADYLKDVQNHANG